MFFVDVNGSEVNVKFSYPDVLVKGEVIKNTKTVCTIYSDNKFVGEGVAYTSKSDQFNRKLGRKISLTRALSKFNRGIRIVIWEVYKSKTKI